MLTPDEHAELGRLADRVASFVRTNNYREFDEIYSRFRELLVQWASEASDPHGTAPAEPRFRSIGTNDFLLAGEKPQPSPASPADQVRDPLPAADAECQEAETGLNPPGAVRNPGN